MTESDLGGITDARMYRCLYLIRRVEEKIADVYPSDRIKSPVHLSIGQEAVSVGVCDVLDERDVVFGSYRGHALYLAKGGDLKRMVAELYGKATGCATGKGGSMHLVDVAAGVMGTSAVVGTTIPNAVGYALGVKHQGNDGLVASFFGDGATEEGVFHESLNFAALKGLPVLFVCENNGYAIHSDQRSRQSWSSIADLASGYGIPNHTFPDGDIDQIRRCVKDVAPRIRAGNGPVLLECATYRWLEHVGPEEDFDMGYRARTEAEPWYRSDAVRSLARRITPQQRELIEQEIDTQITEAFEYAEQSPFPSTDELTTHVYA